MVPSRCRRCGPASNSKHSGALYELYARLHVSDGNRSSGPSNVLDTETREFSSENKQPRIRKLTPNNNTVLLRTSAVRVVDPSTGRSTFVYAQYDTAS